MFSILLSPRSQPERNRSQQENKGRDGEEAWPDKVEGIPVVIKVVPEGSHDHWEVPPHQVHQEEEDSNAGGANLIRNLTYAP